MKIIDLIEQNRVTFPAKFFRQNHISRWMNVKRYQRNCQDQS